MRLEPLAWMAEELGYPALLEHRDGTLTRNTAAERVTPEPCADLRSALASLFAAGVDESLEAALEACRQGEHRSICVEGVKVVAAPTSAGVLVIVARDPDELASLARRATAGEMAAGVAHEVANALSSVIGWCSLARNDPASAPPELALDRAIQGAEIARDAARQLMDWGSVGKERVERLDVGHALGDVASLLRPAAIEAGVAVELDAAYGAHVDGHRPDLVSVIWNLAQNAIRALPRGGTLRLAADCDAANVRIHIIDDGPGMAPDVAKKALQRRFTTHPDGYGLGLPLVLRTVEVMRGTLHLTTQVGRGCHFTIELPPSQRATPPAGLPTLKPAALRGRVRAEGQRVLVVEDDPNVRELLCTMLEIQGFAIYATDNMARAAELGLDCDIALIDLHLESSRGDLVLATLRQSGFRGAAAIMSGGDAPPELVEGGAPDRWLRKPFDPAELMAHLLELRELVRIRRAEV